MQEKRDRIRRGVNKSVSIAVTGGFQPIWKICLSKKSQLDSTCMICLFGSGAKKTGEATMLLFIKDHVNVGRSQWQVHVLIPKPMQLPKFASVLKWLHLDLWHLCRSIDLFRCQMNKIAQSPRCVTSGRGISLTLQHLEVTTIHAAFLRTIFSTDQLHPPPKKKSTHLRFERR